MKKRTWIALLVPVLLAAVLYCMEFSVRISDENLEDAIRDYNFTTSIDVDVLARQKVGNRLFVLYAQLDHAGWGGLAELERGPFGGYRFRSCSNFDGQLYRAKTVTVGKQTMMLLYGLHDLPGVELYEVYCGERVVNSGYTRFETAPPFLRVMSISEAVALHVPNILYYDAEGVEIPAETLKAQIPLAETGNGSATYTAELNLIYGIMSLILICGLLVAGALLPNRKKYAK